MTTATLTPMTPADIDTLAAAAQCYMARKARTEHPDGTFDAKKRFYPSPAEEQPCCSFIRQPSARYPYSLMVHCRTVQHIAALYSVSVDTLRRAVRTATPRAIPQVATRYKVVRILDDETYGTLYKHSDQTYTLGKTYRQAAKPNHNGGWYVRKDAWTEAHGLDHDGRFQYRTVTLREAFLAGDIAGKPADGAIYAMVRCEVWGKCVSYDSGKEAWTYCKPIEEVERFTVNDCQLKQAAWNCGGIAP